MRTCLTMAATAALAWPLPAIPAAAEEEEALEYLERKHDTDRDWRLPRPNRPAEDILRQASGPRPAAELDAFADRVAAMMADATLPEHAQSNAKYVLMGAADTDEPHLGGTPYPRAFDLLVRVYEGTYDGALFAIWLAGDERGPAYVRDVFELSERPPECSRSHWLGSEDDAPECADWWNVVRDSPWCRAGDILYQDAVDEVLSSAPPGLIDRGPIPDGLPEHVEDWYRRCAYL
ncbi:MAG: hypothetical protein J4F34_07470 [Gemmatimonadetes bacterium]|nr:hypothetical protein [Gemmatimonadota bacterium]